MNWFQKWLIKEVTEVTTWAAVAILILALVKEPFWVDCVIAFLLIQTTPDRVNAFIAKYAPKLQKLIEDAGK